MSYVRQEAISAYVRHSPFRQWPERHPLDIAGQASTAATTMLLVRRLSSALRGSSLLTTAVGNLGLKVGAGMLGFLNGVLLARLLGPGEFGNYALIMAVANLAAIVATLGLPALATREIARHEARQEWGLLKGVVHVSHGWTLMAVVIILIAVALLIVPGWVLSQFNWPVLVLAGVLVPLGAFGQLRAATLRGLHRVILADIPELLIRPFLVFALACWAYLVFGRIGTAEAVMYQMVAALVSVVIGGWLLYRHMPDVVSKAASQSDIRFWLKEASPFFLLTIIGLLEGQVGIYLLGYLSESGQVAFFQVANQLASLVVLGLTAVNLPLQPKLVKARAAGNTREAQRLVTEATKMGSVLALMAALLLIPFSGVFIAIYGQGYKEAADVLRVIVIGQVVNALSGPCGLVLAATGHQKLALYGISAALVVNALVCVWLVPAQGALGAAWAMLCSLVVWNALLVFWAKRHSGIETIVTAVFKGKKAYEPT